MNNKITMGLVGAAIAAMAIAPSFKDDDDKKINVSKDVGDNSVSSENQTALSDDLIKEYKSQIESLLDKKTNSMTVSENISTLTDAYSMEEAESIAQTIYRELNLAQAQDFGNDSVTTLGGYPLSGGTTQHTGTWCHGACHGACHSACHGSRGWR